MHRSNHNFRTRRRSRGEPRAAGRSGFTLVELLMVILIISMLVALISAAVWRAQVTAKNARVTAEINQMVMQLKEYKPNRGGYRADVQNWPDAEILVRLRANFPKWNANVNPAPAVLSDNNRNNRLDEAEQLVFWLGGFWNSAQGSMDGFGAHAQRPFTVGGQRSAPLFDFKETRLFDADSDGWPEYYPDDPQYSGPYVLFVARPNKSYFDYNNNLPVFQSPRAQGTAVPLLSDSGGWANNSGIQIFAPGIDNDYGPAGQLYFPSGQGYSTQHYDNLSNLATGTLEDAIP